MFAMTLGANTIMLLNTKGPGGSGWPFDEEVRGVPEYLQLIVSFRLIVATTTAVDQCTIYSSRTRPEILPDHRDFRLHARLCVLCRLAIHSCQPADQARGTR